jgi:hypothetical protein
VSSAGINLSALALTIERVLRMKPLEVLWSFVGTAALALLGFASLQVYQLNASVAVVSYKVDENNSMIRPMWQDFLIRKAGFYDRIEDPDSVPSIQTTQKK